VTEQAYRISGGLSGDELAKIEELFHSCLDLVSLFYGQAFLVKGIEDVLDQSVRDFCREIRSRKRVERIEDGDVMAMGVYLCLRFVRSCWSMINDTRRRSSFDSAGCKPTASIIFST
jgi:hypothetical protein